VSTPTGSNNFFAEFRDNSPDHTVLADAFHSAAAGDSITMSQWLAHQSASHLI
jgi:hypothetical protein